MRLIKTVIIFVISLFIASFFVSCGPSNIPCECTVVDEYGKAHRILGHANPDRSVDLCLEITNRLDKKGISYEHPVVRCTMPTK